MKIMDNPLRLNTLVGWLMKRRVFCRGIRQAGMRARGRRRFRVVITHGECCRASGSLLMRAVQALSRAVKGAWLMSQAQGPDGSPAEPGRQP